MRRCESKLVLGSFAIDCRLERGHNGEHKIDKRHPIAWLLFFQSEPSLKFRVDEISWDGHRGGANHGEKEETEKQAQETNIRLGGSP